ncbi:MAG: iron ABC transporter permease [Thermoprotei archaeon]|nr:MAG: iron ABC transporter permease [Thermoprotei archaeon]
MGGSAASKLRKLSFYLDPVLIAQLLLPTTILFLFLVAPLLLVAYVAGQYSIFDVLSDPTYFSLRPRGQPVLILRTSFRGREVTIIKVVGVSFGAVINSLINAVIVTAGATVLGVAVAFVFARYEFPGKTVLRILATMPLLLTPFINVFVIRKLFDWRDGIISWFVCDVLGLPLRLGVDSIAGVAVAQIMTFFPLVYLNVYSSMVNIDPSLEEQAENLGAKGFRLFRTVTLPLSLPGLAAGSALVFIFSLEDVAAPIVFNEKRFISYQVFSKFIEATTGQLSPVAAILALILLLLALTIFASIRRYVMLRQYAMLSRGGRWKPRMRKLSAKGLLAIYLVLAPLLVFLAFPQLGVIIYAFSERWTGPLPQGFTLKNLWSIVEDPLVSRAVINSLTYSLSALALIILLGISASYVIARARVPGVDLLDLLVTSPVAIPGLVIAVGYFYFFTTFFRGTPLDPIVSGPSLLLVLAYSVRRLPFTARAVFAGLQQVHIALEEASLNLGAGRLRTLVNIVIPLISLNLLSGALVSFVYCMSETSTSITLGGLGGVGESHQAPITFIMLDYLNRVGGPHIVASLGVLLISLQLLVITLVNVVFKQRYAYVGV